LPKVVWFVYLEHPTSTNHNDSNQTWYADKEPILKLLYEYQEQPN
jgi:hypothetical protein